MNSHTFEVGDRVFLHIPGNVREGMKGGIHSTRIVHKTLRSGFNDIYITHEVLFDDGAIVRFPNHCLTSIGSPANNQEAKSFLEVEY